MEASFSLWELLYFLLFTDLNTWFLDIYTLFSFYFESDERLYFLGDFSFLPSIRNSNYLFDIFLHYFTYWIVSFQYFSSIIL